jgi:hypothetical protein
MSVNVRFQFKNKVRALAVSAVRNFRDPVSKQPTNYSLAYLGSIREGKINDQAARFAFWEKCAAELEKLKNSDDERKKITEGEVEKLRKKILERIPPAPIKIPAAIPKPAPGVALAPKPIVAQRIVKNNNPRLAHILGKYKERIG